MIDPGFRWRRTLPTSRIRPRLRFVIGPQTGSSASANKRGQAELMQILGGPGVALASRQPHLVDGVNIDAGPPGERDLGVVEAAGDGLAPAVVDLVHGV